MTHRLVRQKDQRGLSHLCCLDTGIGPVPWLPSESTAEKTPRMDSRGPALVLKATEKTATASPCAGRSRDPEDLSRNSTYMSNVWVGMGMAQPQGDL